MKMFMIYVLGLLLFLLYIEDIKSVIQNTYCHLYANPDKKVWRELSNIDHWLSINKLYNKIVRYLDTPLESKDKVKYPGVLFDKKMQWKYQIRNIITFKAPNNIAPNYLSSKIQMAKNWHSHNTRRAVKNHLQIPYTKFAMRTFAYRTSKLWNYVATK